MDAVDREVRLEGLLWRVTRAPGRSGDDEALSLALDKTVRLFRHGFRLESATDYGYPWREHGAIRSLMKNYPAVLRLVAAESAKAGDLSTAGYAIRAALEILTFHGDAATAEAMMDYWDEIDPGHAPFRP
jgi:hypothetical protein